VQTRTARLDGPSGGTRDITANPSKRRSRPVALVVSVGLLVVTAWMMGRRAGEKRLAAEAHSADAELLHLARRLDQLENEQRSQRALSSLPPVATSAHAEQHQEQAQAPEAASAEPPVQPPSSKEMYADLEAKFAAEAPDRGWAMDTESRLSSVIAGFKGSTLKSLSCRSSMCRIEATFANLEGREEFESGFTTADVAIGKHFWGQRFTEEDGTLRVVILLSRGSSLPVSGREPSK